MILIQGEMGNVDLIFPPVATLRQKVDLGRPITRYCRALLRGFDLSNYSEDRHLRDVRVQLYSSFGDDLQHVELTAEIALTDSPSDSAFDWTAISVAVQYTIVAE